MDSCRDALRRRKKAESQVECPHNARVMEHAYEAEKTVKPVPLSQQFTDARVTEILCLSLCVVYAIFFLLLMHFASSDAILQTFLLLTEDTCYSLHFLSALYI